MQQYDAAASMRRECYNIWYLNFEGWTILDELKIDECIFTFVLTDSQPVCWLLRHKDDNIKLSRWLLKIFEFRINIVVTHVAGNRNNIPDFLSRMYYVPEVKSKDGVELTPKAAQHIQSPFSPLAVLTRDDILRDFHKDVVSPCNQPLLCHLNVNNFLFKNLGPFEPTYTCLDNPEVKKLYGPSVRIIPKLCIICFTFLSFYSFRNHNMP